MAAGHIPTWYARPKTVTHPSTNRPIVRRPGIELTTIESLFRRRNLTTEPPTVIVLMTSNFYPQRSAMRMLRSVRLSEAAISSIKTAKRLLIPHVLTTVQ